MHPYPQIVSNEKKKHEEIFKQIEQVRNQLKQTRRVIDQNLCLAIEAVEPTFVLPSFESTLSRWADLLDEKKFSDFLCIYGSPYKVERVGTLLLEWPPEKLNEIYQLMPINIRQFVDKFNIDPWHLTTYAQSDKEEFLLVIADYIFNLPTAPSTTIYIAAKLFLQQTNDINSIFDHFGEMDNPLEYALQDGKNCMENVIKLRDQISVIQNSDKNMTRYEKAK
jgi:hypothetical protein